MGFLGDCNLKSNYPIDLEFLLSTIEYIYILLQIFLTV